MQLRITSRKKFTVLLCALGLISIVAIYPRQTVNFFYSTAIQIKDYIHFYGYRPVKSFTDRPVLYSSTIIDLNSVLYFFISTHPLMIKSILTT